MRKFLFLLCLLPSIGISQTKNVMYVERITPKADKIAEFEKAIAAHAQKYHTGDWKWRVSQVQTGPDAGSYVIVEGPSSWTDQDTRGDLGAEHTADWNKLFGTTTTGKIEAMAMVYRADLSSGQLTDFAEKNAITHVYPRIGFGGKVEANLRKAKKVWDASGQTVIVYESSSSGEPQFIVVYRYKTGWKERETSFRKPFTERYNETYGPNSYDEYLETIQRFTSRVWSEMILYRADLSSK
ncbi:hypothetical protein QQ054_13750 [Oscillatoria amoena NRMC-F 0135]|nr:hypothetical protein [Oscillatoria amoena NRMC-F 0135]